MAGIWAFTTNIRDIEAEINTVMKLGEDKDDQLVCCRIYTFLGIKCFSDMHGSNSFFLLLISKGF